MAKREEGAKNGFQPPLEPQKWAKTAGGAVGAVARVAMQHNRMPAEYRRDRPLSLTGVGNGSQECTHNLTLPIAMRRLDGTHSSGTCTITIEVHHADSCKHERLRT